MKARKKKSLLNTFSPSSIPFLCFSLISYLIKLVLCSLHSYFLPRAVLWLTFTLDKRLMRLAAILEVCVEIREHITSTIGRVDQISILFYTIICIKHWRNLVPYVHMNKPHLPGYGVTQCSPKKSCQVHPSPAELKCSENRHKVLI